MAKPTRQEYLNQRLAEAKKVNPNVSVKIPKNPTPAQLKTLRCSDLP
jgi:hypothetical protein